MAAPRYILFAGVNGAGKSTLFKSGLWDRTSVSEDMPRVNSDEILVAHGWDWADRSAQLRAGREALELVRTCLESRTSFNQESTLTGHSIMRTISSARQRGFAITLYYVGVDDPEIANRRIKRRTELGGHGVDPETVRRRARSSFDNLVKAVPLCDEAFLFDNTYLLKPVARIARGDLVRYEFETMDVSWPDEIMQRLIAADAWAGWED
ncbi:AAA family ATPase [Arabiibacter massiliensis]|uniref:AAA family ATPase n=1 Tax=Arabiibacter massiliensis TaxID=1870985 RepID=UPI0009B93B68|nr:AAA family ATPase [Arabiibacter massiliensis]